MIDLRTKKAMVVDRGGMFVSWAQRLARDFGEVHYHNPAWKKLDPKTRELLIGYGLPGVEMVKNFWKKAHEIDLFIFTANLDGDLQDELVRQGKRVWGVRGAEDLELYRAEAKREMMEQGMPMNKFWVVHGIKELRECLKEHPNTHVKVPLVRGDTETFSAPSLAQVEPKLFELQHELDASGEILEFVIEENIPDALEIGYDGWYIAGGGFPVIAMNGIEVKDKCYGGVILPYGDLDPNVLFVNKKLAPLLDRYGCRGFLSTEIRVGADEIPIPIDLTLRCPSPPSESEQEWIANWGLIMWHGAEGTMVRPEPVAKYAVQACIYSDFADDNWLPVTFSEELAPWVKLFFHSKINGKDRVMPQTCEFNEVGWVVGIGDTMDEAIAACQEHAEALDGYRLEVKTDAIQNLLDEIKKGEELGVQFSDDPMPETVSSQ